MDVSINVEKLKAMQEVDGGWADVWFYKGFTTALGVNALRGYIEEPKGKEYKKLERDRVTVVKPELVYSHMSSAPPSSVTQGMRTTMEALCFVGVGIGGSYPACNLV
uniref:Uncharacterized protein n=1 Tax=Moniliophthora roreri TaxID=221103 RepID=A0A0W0FJT5_MONRR